MSDEFYLQDSRSYVGNDMLFWALDGNGYTTDLRKAQVYSKVEAIARHQARETDIPWPKAYIDARQRPAVDFQYCKRAEALDGVGIVLIKSKPTRRHTINCCGCGKFLAEASVYTENCTYCGANNRP